MANEGNITLEVETRSDTGGTACRRMRRAGRIPGNVYGLDRPPFKVAVNPRGIDAVLHLASGVNTVFQLALKGEDRTREAMIKELQRDPVTGLAIHVDFIRVDLSKAIEIAVPVHLIGTPEGVKNEGGVVDFVNRSVQVECLPNRIPEHLDIDVSALHINQHVSVSDITTGEGVRMLDDPEQIIAVVVAPRVEEVAATEEEAEAVEGEPEVAEKGKEGEEATETPASDKKAGS